MRKLLAILLILFSGVQSYAQHANFSQKVFSCDFTPMDKTYWPQINNSGFNFIIEDGHYLLECLDPAKKAYAPLRWDKRPEVYKVETNVTIQRGNEGTFGLVYSAQEKLESGYILQIDKDKRYRICIIESNNLRPLTGDRNLGGWLEFKKLNKAGMNNKIVVIQDDGKISIQLNDAPLITYHNKLKSLSGEFGFMLTGKSKAVIEDFNVYGSGAPLVDSITLKATIAQKETAADTIVKTQQKPKPDSTVADAVSGNPAASLKTPPAKASKEKDKKKTRDKNSKKHEEKVADKKEVAPFQKTIAKDTLIKDTTVVVAAASPVVEVKVPPADAKSSKNTSAKDKKTSKTDDKKQAQKNSKDAKVVDLQPAVKDSTKDITTLSIALGDSRREAMKLKKENENLSAELKQVKMKNEELQAYINKYLDVKMKTDLDIEKNKNEVLTKDNEKLKEENSDLKGLKQNIAKAKDGDIIIVLSDDLKNEQKKNDELTQKIKELEDKLKAKSAPAKPIQKPKPDTKPAQNTKADPNQKNATTPGSSPATK